MTKIDIKQFLFYVSKVRAEGYFTLTDWFVRSIYKLDTSLSRDDKVVFWITGLSEDDCALSGTDRIVNVLEAPNT